MNCFCFLDVKNILQLNWLHRECIDSNGLVYQNMAGTWSAKKSTQTIYMPNEQPDKPENGS